MSVLNDVLRDLVRRQAVPAEVPDSLMAGIMDDTHGEAATRRKSRSDGMTWMVLAMAAIMLGYAVAPDIARYLSTGVEQETALPKARQRVSADEPIAPARVARTGVSQIAASATSLRLADSFPLSAIKTPLREAPGTRATMHMPAGSPRADGVRIHQTAAEATGHIALNQPADFRVFALTRPERIVVDIFGAEGPIEDEVVEGQGVVERVRTRTDRPEGLRVVLDLNGPAQIRKSEIVHTDQGGSELQIRIVPVTAVPPRPAAASSSPGSASGGDVTSTSPVVPPPAVPSVDVAGKSGVAAGLMRKTPAVLSPSDRAASRYRDALRLARSGRNADADASLRAALDADPAHRQARELLAARSLDQRRFIEAETLLSEGLDRWPEHLGLRRLYARLWLDRGDPARGLKTLQVQAPTLASDPEYHAFRAGLLQKTGQHAEAGRLYGELVALRPEAGVWWLGLAISLEAGGRVQEALDAYRQAADKADMTPALLRFVDSRTQSLNPHITSDPS